MEAKSLDVMKKSSGASLRLDRRGGRSYAGVILLVQPGFLDVLGDARVNEFRQGLT